MSVISPRAVYRSMQKDAGVDHSLHNHPSGDPEPSREDILVTKKIAKAGELIGITLMDHIIIGDQSYVSLAEKGWV